MDKWDDSLYESLKEGDTDPKMGKVIKFLVLQSKGFIVYIDTNIEIQWHHSDEINTNDEFGDVLNRVAYLENISRFVKELNDDCERMQSIKRQIAEGIARYLDYKKLSLSKEILSLVESEILALNRKVSWRWYFTAAYSSAAICLFFWILLWLDRDHYSSMFGSTGFEVILGGLMGAQGAISSVVSRGKALSLDANAGKPIHTVEAISRIIVGIVGASLVSLAIKAGILLGGTHFSGNQFAVLLTFALVAGASERFVPNLIGKIENIHHAN